MQKIKIKLKLTESNREKIKGYIFNCWLTTVHVGEMFFIVKELKNDCYNVRVMKGEDSGDMSVSLSLEEACDLVDKYLLSHIKEGSEEELVSLVCLKDMDYDFATNKFTLDSASYTVYMNNEEPLYCQYELIASKMASFDYATVFGFYDGGQTLLDYKYDFYHNTIEGEVEERPLREVLEKEILPVVVSQIDNPDYDKVSFYIRGENDRTLPRPKPRPKPLPLEVLDEDNYMSILALLDDD